jgi:hypothetical protein
MARLAGAFVLLTGVLLAGPVRADEAGRLRVDWAKFADVLRQGTLVLGHDGGFRLGEEGRAVPLRSPDDLPWVGSSAHLALVARDWGGARGLLGGLSLMDRLRPIRSTRMLVTRARLSDGRVTPFIQMGLGQWRIDTDLMPALRRDVELAGQFGGGIEISLTPSAVIALEADETILYRAQHEPQMACQPRIWNSLLAARVEF